MLSMSDTPILPHIALFSSYGVDVAFLVPTETGYKKSIMDATAPVRELVKRVGFHDYSVQQKGPINKRMLTANFVLYEGLIETTVSLYRPETKDGDPRIWFRDLKTYCKPNNLLAIVATEDKLYVFNLSNPEVVASLKDGVGSRILSTINRGFSGIVEELLYKMRQINKKGFILGEKSGDTSVGMTLERELGIAPNSSPKPDYKGIEIKAGRVAIQKNRVNLFSQVPDWKGSKTTRQKVLKDWGYISSDKQGKPRFNLYCTVEANTPNPQGLYFSVDTDRDMLINLGYKDRNLAPQFVVKWDMAKLRERLLEKHKRTFWVSAVSEKVGNNEYFRYDSLVYTSEPKASYMPYLIDTKVITMDYVMHEKEDGSVRDHGFLFKIRPDNISLLFPNPLEFDLRE